MKLTFSRLTSITGGLTKTNTYDTVGNLTNDGSTSLTYDGRGRMLTSTSAGLTTSYVINYAGQRVKKANSTETVYYVYDDAGHMIGEYDAAGTLIQELIWLGDTPVALRGKMPCLTGGTCTETANAYIWTDHLNTPREITRVNASNVHVSMWKWDSLPFGETLPNANPTNLGVMTFNHRFPGQYRDKETGLHQNWHRDYDPKIGRYIESDPIGLGAGPNPYSYVNASPLKFADPQGLNPCLTVGSGFRSFFRDLGFGIIHGLAGTGILGEQAKQACTEYEKNFQANLAKTIDKLTNDQATRDAVVSTLRGLAATPGFTDALIGRAFAAQLTSSVLSPAATVIATTGSLINRLGGIPESTFTLLSGLVSEAGGNPTAENIALVALLLAAGSC